MKIQTLFMLIACYLTSLAVAQHNTLQAGDQVSMSIKGIPADEQQSVSGAYAVNTSGQIKVPHLKNMISVSGLTLDAASRKIEAAYKAAQIYTSPTVVLFSQRVQDRIKAEQEINNIEDLAKFVTVMGQVGRPGPIPYREGMTLSEAVSQSAPNAFADWKKIKLTRDGKEYIINLRIAKYKTLKLVDGDLIEIDVKKF